MSQLQFKLEDKRRFKARPERVRVRGHKPMGMSGIQIKWALTKHPKWALEHVVG